MLAGMLNPMRLFQQFPRSPWVFRSLWLLAASFLLAMTALLAYGAYLATFLELPRSEDHPPLRLYTAPFQLKTGLSVKTARLPERLQRLGYKAVAESVAAPGDYRLTAEKLTIFLHAQPEAFVKANVVTLEVQEGQVTQVLSEPDRTPIFPVFLEPELISGLRGTSRQVREWIPLARIPDRLTTAILAVEDRRFYSHVGIDPVAVGRAVWRNLTKGGVVQGGSTITQQLAKNLFYSPQRTFIRKVKEALAAVLHLRGRHAADDRPAHEREHGEELPRPVGRRVDCIGAGRDDPTPQADALTA